MRLRRIIGVGMLLMLCFSAGCGQTKTQEPALPDGVYRAEFHTDSSMFHANEACDGKGVLTVKDGTMTIHVSLASKTIQNLYLGLAADAQKDGAVLLQPTLDPITYADGFSEQVHGFDIPVPKLEKEFDLALIGKKGIWYDHKVSVSNPVPMEEAAVAESTVAEGKPMEDGIYAVDITLEGGSGKSKIQSPCSITVKDGKTTATLIWSSSKYDYMLVDGEKYLPITTEGGSTFEVPVTEWDVPLKMIADTTAMSTPHEVVYLITFHSKAK